jgi:hypothetical protein
MTTAQQQTKQNLEDQWGETFSVQSTDSKGTITLRKAAPEWEPSPVRYEVATDGATVEIDRDGFRVENDEDWS